MNTVLRIITVFAAFVAAIILYRHALLSFFYANIVINSVIMAVFIIGFLLVLRNSWVVYRERQWFLYAQAVLDNTSYSAGDPPAPKLLLDLAKMINNTPSASFSLNAQEQSIVIETLNSSFEQSRETVRYIISLLIFLGLIGTFWGLLHTIQAVGDVVGSLGAEGSDSFLSLQKGLVGPLDGMGTAFSSSLFGLTGSLILGLLALMGNHAQDNFSTKVQNWLAGYTTLGLGEHRNNNLSDAVNQTNNAFEHSLMEGLIDKLDRLSHNMQSQQHIQQEIYNKLSSMNDGITAMVKSNRRHHDDIESYMQQHDNDLHQLYKQSTISQQQYHDDLRDNIQLLARTLSKK